MKRLVTISFVLAGLLLLAACGGSNPSGTQETAAPKTEPAASGSPKNEPNGQPPKPDAKQDPSQPTSSPAKQEPVKSEPAKTEPPKSEPAKTEPPKSEPAKQEPPAGPKTEPAPAPKPEPKPETKQEPKAEPSKTADSTANAEALFKDNCMACHGGKLEGGIGPNLQKVGSRKTKEEIINQIVKGSDDMPAFGKKLDPTAIETLAAWLAAKK